MNDNLIAPQGFKLDPTSFIRVGWGGTRRCCFKIADTGLCVKFYKPRSLYDAENVKPSIRRDIDSRRFDERKNSSCQEVAIYERYKRRLPAEVFSHFPPRCEKVFHPDFGWGVLETYYTNPDGSAIIPYEFEIARQTPRNREIIYAQARELLEELASSRAPFYEPGNFHTLVTRDGKIETKIVDFEPDSKTLFRPEAIFPFLRSLKLRRKAKRYLAHIRRKYGVRGNMTMYEAGDALGMEFAEFEPLGKGNSSLNFRAVTADGSKFFVKYARRDAIEKSWRLLSGLATPLVPRMIMPRSEAMDGKNTYSACEWREGFSIPPDKWGRDEIEAVCNFHRSLVASLDSAPRDGLKTWDGFEELAPGRDKRVIHGDLHYCNFFFSRDGEECKVETCFDFERARLGLPAEDLLRIFIHEIERTRFWNFARLRRLERNLKTTIAASGYSRDDFRSALALYVRHKKYRRAKKKKLSLFASIENFLRELTYRRVRLCILSF